MSDFDWGFLIGAGAGLVGGVLVGWHIGLHELALLVATLEYERTHRPTPSVARGSD